jgi:hypothetical protein
LLPAQFSVMGARRSLVTLIGRLAMSTNDVATVSGAVGVVIRPSALDCGEGGENEDGGLSVTGGSGVASTVNAMIAGDASTLPARSVARTSNVWDPSLRGPETQGDEQGTVSCASTLHSNVALGSSDEKVNVAVGLLVGSGGPVSIVVSGGVRSTVHA